MNTVNNINHKDLEISLQQKKDHSKTLRPPTVMQVLPKLVTGGVERGTVDIASAILNGGGHSIVVSAGGPMVKELKRLGINHYELPVDSKNPFIIWQNIKKLLKIAKHEQVDIIHARSRAPAWSAWWAARKSNVYFVTTFHGTYNHSNWFKIQYNAVMTKGDRIIAISNFIAGHIVKIYGIPVDNIRIIPRGIDIDKYSATTVSQERRIKLASQWRLPDDKIIILLPGRLTRWKGHTVFIEAIKKVNKENIQCLIVGSDLDREDYKHELERKIDTRGMQNLIHVVGHCDDMPAAYMITDIVVSASTDPEAFGRVMVEGQSMGRLVIASNHGGSQETILEGKTGWLFKPNDPESLAKTLELVLGLTEKERGKVANTARKHVLENYSKEMMCSKTLEVYNELILSNAK